DEGDARGDGQPPLSRSHDKDRPAQGRYGPNDPAEAHGHEPPRQEGEHEGPMGGHVDKDVAVDSHRTHGRTRPGRTSPVNGCALRSTPPRVGWKPRARPAR